ncbi:CHAT domain-containing tetratricopeptide repeat protein [Luteitalea sp.]|uniref:CHAT domain-containing protein n=1 Tax=Luteitalea sp. TaxID=2004800 RepID=UPI0025C6FC0C|nr:CHAT domain-containing tetratricopeptide repeat protein [Luteitalea sp.]
MNIGRPLPLLLLLLAAGVHQGVARARGAPEPQAPSAPVSSVTAAETPAHLVDEGIRLISLNRLDDAWAVLVRARDQAVAAGDLVVEGRAEWGLGRVAFLRRDDAATEEHYARAARRLDDAAAFELRATLALQRGRELSERGAHAAAEQQWRAGVALTRAHGPRWLQAQLLRSLTFVATVPMADRLVLIEEAERSLEGEQRPALEGLVAHQHGDLAFLAGDYIRALRETERAVGLLERAGARADLARALTSVGRIYRVHGEPEQAIPWFRRALDVQRGIDNTPAEVQNLIGLGIAHLHLARFDEAAAAYAEAVAVARTSPQPSDLVHALTQQAIGLVEMQRVPEAERSLAEALVLPAEPRLLGSLQGARGTVAFAARRYAEALAAFDLALEAPGLGVDSRVETLERRARALDALDRPDEAIIAADAALEALGRLRASLVPRDYFKRGFDQSWARLFGLSVRRLALAGEATRALEVAERARARAFADLVASRLVENSPSLSAAASTTPPPSPGLVLRGASGGPAAGARAGGTALESAAAVDSATVDQMRSTATALGATIVSYWVDAEVTLVWVITPQGDVHMRRLPIGARDLERAILATQATPGAEATRFSTGPASRAAFRRLHDALIAPVQRWLPARDGLVTIVPHGPLFRLSFAALTRRDGRYLVEDHALLHAPSVAVLRLVAGRAPRAGPPSYLLLGNPAWSAARSRREALARLPGAAREVEAIRRRVAPAAATVLRDGTASELALRQAAPGASVLHLATHAIVDDARPFESYLALASQTSEEGDGRLTAEEVYGLWLDADLVVLSACRSATGPVTGDGLLGLTRAFIAAGARSVIATLWDLPDEAARAILPHFYREWLATGNKAEALRRAQLAWLADLRTGRVVVDSPLGAVTLREHPALWASLVLQGRP